MTWISRAMKVDSVQVSRKLRKSSEGLMHWCPGCEEMHLLPKSWSFDGNLESPTFTPSFLHTGGSTDIRRQCHYNLTAGVLFFHADCTHGLASQNVPLPDLPFDLWDEGWGQ